jgi:uncharacterized protein DUF6484
MKNDEKLEPETTMAAAEEATEEALEPAQEGEETLLELVLAEHAARGAEEEAEAPARIDGVVVGRLVGVDADGSARVDFAGRSAGGDEGAKAMAMTPIGAGDAGRAVAILFEGGNPGRPVIMGFMHAGTSAAATPLVPDVEGDGERLVFSAEKEIVLRCGNASITLTRAGKVLIRGAYLLARSSGVNRIQGGSVQIN